MEDKAEEIKNDSNDNVSGNVVPFISADSENDKPKIVAKSSGGKVKTPIELEEERARRWKSLLYRPKPGAMPYKSMANAIVALRESPEWRGALKYDENALDSVLIRQPPKPWRKEASWTPRVWEDNDDALLCEWLTSQGIVIGKTAASDAVPAAAKERSFHPIRDYLNGLKWDGKPRIDNWLQRHLGAADTIFNGAVGRRTLIAAVARIMNPGCQFDHVLIFEGLQGRGKSSLIRALPVNESWFLDKLKRLDDADTARSMRKKWIVELAELETFRGDSEETIKAFITRRTDTIRFPYGRRHIDIHRQCILIGSTNEKRYLHDSTGGRRFWPVEITKMDIDGIALVRDQLWAEAKHYYDKGAPWYLETPELQAMAQEVQRERYISHPAEELVETFLIGKTHVKVAEIALEVFRIQQAELSFAKDKEIRKILHHLRWKDTVTTHPKYGRNVRCFIRE